MSDRRKLLWHSNSPWSPTGYGNQTGLFAKRLLDHYDLRCSSFYGLEGMPLTWDGINVLPGLGGTYGNESIPFHAARFFGDPNAGLIVTLMDVWVLQPQMCAQYNMASWVPIDHDPAPPRVMNFFRESGSVPIAMSRFGQDRLAEFEPLYCPHGVDTKIYRPIPRKQARERLGVDEDVFLVGMVAANKGNPSRKHFVATLEAFAQFQKKHSNAKLYLHADMEGTFTGGVHLGRVIDGLGIPPESIGFTDPYAIHFHPMSAEAMANVYSAFDVLVNPAAGEGFGITVLEAQACGTPAIVTDFSAMAEVCGAGWKVDGSRWWTVQEAWQRIPFVSDIVEALEECYGLSSKERARLSSQARNHAMNYDVDRVLEQHMLPALEGAWERMGERPLELVA